MIVGITGASGFIGSNLICRLAQRADLKIIGLVRKVPHWLGPASDRIEWRQGDLLSMADCTALMEGIDVLIHLASATIPLSTRSVVDETNLSLLPTLNLIQAARESQRRIHIIFASSGGQVYGINDNRVPWREDERCEPVSMYGAGKLAAEHHLHVMAKEGSIRATVLRIANVYGAPLAPERKQGLLGIAVHQLAAGLPVPLIGDIENVRDYVHLDDVCHAFELACGQKTDFECFNIGTGRGFSTRQLLDVLALKWGSAVPVENKEMSLSKTLIIPWNVLSNEKARRAGWHPAVVLEDGIERMIHDARK